MKFSFLSYCIFLQLLVYGQKFPIENFNVDKGLSQSQVSAIAQDKQKHLWVGTFSGLNRFDGTSFKLYTKNDGLPSNSVYALHNSSNGNIWIGTEKGISRYDGNRFVNFLLNENAEKYSIKTIIEDAEGIIYALDLYNGLLQIDGKQLKRVNMPFPEEVPRSICIGSNGSLLAYIYKKGLYEKRKNGFILKLPSTFLEAEEYPRMIIEKEAKYFAITNKLRLVKFSHEGILAIKKVDAGYLDVLNIDSRGDLWVGTASGAQIFNSMDLALKTTLTSTNGLTDNFVNDIYKDSDDNIWLGTDGEGLFKYSGGKFLKYDKTNCLNGNVVMGFAKTNNGRILIGTREGGLLAFNNNTKSFNTIDYSMCTEAGVNCVGVDSTGVIYISTIDNRLLKKNTSGISEILIFGKYRPAIFSIIPYHDKVIVATSIGVYIISSKSFTRLPNFNEAVYNIMPLANDSFLFATNKGVVVYAKNEQSTLVNMNSLKNINVSCFEKYENYIIVGSFDEGIFIWDRISNKVIPFDKSKGLADNNIFGILRDSKDNIWVGTSSGLHQLIFNKSSGTISVKRFSIADGYESSETNLNAIFEDATGNIWVGTTKGAFVYHPLPMTSSKSIRPFTIIQRVDISGTFDTSKNDLTSWYQLPVNPKIEYKYNGIGFTFKGIYLKDPESISYSYQLVGIDSGFLALGKQNYVNYKNLEPGNYIFKVKSYTADGIPSSNTYEYPFTIVAPFYKTIWFKFLVTGILLLMGSIIQLIYSNEKRKKIRQMKLIVAKEQQKVRQQTADDFHDELGNKLTRITLLTELLENKMDATTDDEKINLVRQIRTNALALYTGTKEIIWSLSTQSDSLKEVFESIRQTGNEIFNNTPINFKFIGMDHLSPSMKLPLSHNRNVVMIFKELLNNSLRHSKCNEVIIEVQFNKEGKLIAFYSDNGSGFDINTIKKGKGLTNLKNRIEKIGGTLINNSIINIGTTYTIAFNVENNPQKK